jgi:hypothetical protein
MRRYGRAFALVSVVLLAGCVAEESDESEAFCDVLTRRRAELVTAADPDKTPAAFAELAEAAPSSITEEMDLLAVLVQQVASVDRDDTRALSALFVAASSPDTKDAARVVTRYAADECGVDLQAVPGPSVTIPPLPTDTTLGR